MSEDRLVDLLCRIIELSKQDASGNPTACPPKHREHAILSGREFVAWVLCEGAEIRQEQKQRRNIPKDRTKRVGSTRWQVSGDPLEAERVREYLARKKGMAGNAGGK